MCVCVCFKVKWKETYNYSLSVSDFNEVKKESLVNRLKSDHVYHRSHILRSYSCFDLFYSKKSIFLISCKHIKIVLLNCTVCNVLYYVGD